MATAKKKRFGFGEFKKGGVLDTRIHSPNFFKEIGYAKCKYKGCKKIVEYKYGLKCPEHRRIERKLKPEDKRLLDLL